jgi:hypothetical protein
LLFDVVLFNFFVSSSLAHDRLPPSLITALCLPPTMTQQLLSSEDNKSNQDWLARRRPSLADKPTINSTYASFSTIHISVDVAAPGAHVETLSYPSYPP